MIRQLKHENMVATVPARCTYATVSSWRGPSLAFALFNYAQTVAELTSPCCDSFSLCFLTPPPVLPLMVPWSQETCTEAVGGLTFEWLLQYLLHATHFVCFGRAFWKIVGWSIVWLYWHCHSFLLPFLLINFAIIPSSKRWVGRGELCLWYNISNRSIKLHFLEGLLPFLS